MNKKVNGQDDMNEIIVRLENWRSVAEHMYAALDSCVTQIEQMKGMFDDNDHTIAGSLKDAELALEAFNDVRLQEKNAPAIAINLNIFDDDGNIVDGTTSNLTVDQISDIVDHASQLVIVQREGGDVDAVMAELEDSLVAADVIDERVDVSPGGVCRP